MNKQFLDPHHHHRMHSFIELMQNIIIQMFHIIVCSMGKQSVACIVGFCSVCFLDVNWYFCFEILFRFLVCNDC